MKKPILTALLLAFATVGMANADKLRIMTTFTVLEDITKNIAGNLADVKSLTEIGAEIHDYEPTAKDLVKLNNSDLIISNGLNLERWFQRFYSKSSKKIPTVVASQGVVEDLITSGPYKGTPNPHGWMSLKNAYIYIDNIENALAKYDPENAAAYHANAKAYREKIAKMESDINKFLQESQLTSQYLITSESAFSYLARDINLKYASIWPVNTEEEGTPKQISDMVNLIKANNIKVVFSGSTMNIKPMQVIMKETGAVFGGYLYVDTLSDKDGPVPTYLDMLSKSIYQIIDGFKKVK